VSNFIPLFVPVADRYLYLPLAGLSLALAAILGPRRWVQGLATLSICALCVLTLRRQAVWHDNVSLWTETLRQNPRSITAANNLGFALWGRGRFEEALAPWKKALDLSLGRAPDPWAGLALGLHDLGRVDEARAAYARAVSLDLRYGEPERLVKMLLWERGQAEALKRVNLAGGMEPPLGTMESR
jgi:tetratricopeptide (TPR) repeat protein